MVSLLPVVSAFEAHLVNVTAHVKEPFNVVKSMRLADSQEIAGHADEINDTLGDHLNYTNCNPPGATADYVPIRTCIVWVVRIDISNPFSYPIHNVIVTDHFGAELNGELIEEGMPVEVTTPPPQLRITWYPTCLSWDGTQCLDNGGILASGESATLNMLVWTEKNPAGKQEYTSPGSYTLNSGPTMKWRDPQDHQGSSEGDSLVVVVYEP